MVLGLHRDREMGPVVMVGLGGVWLELFKDVAFAPPWLDENHARRVIMRDAGGTPARRLSRRAACDIGALARAMAALGRIATDLGDALESLDVNPIIVTEDGAYARGRPSRPARH